jgi:sugar/nucleoside kinase (ribokinase family)
MIVGLGCLAHDHVAVTDTPWAAGKGHIIHREDRFGGNAPNALATIAALGYPAAYLATVGTSETGDAGVADLAARGVTTDFVQRLSGSDPVEAHLTITADGERYIAFDNSPLARTPLPDQPTVDAALANASALLVDATSAPQGSIDVVRAARDRQIPVVLDVERDPTAAVADLMNEADHLVVPLSFGRRLTERDAPEEVIDSLWGPQRSAVVLTDGSRGSYGGESPGSVVHTPAFASPVVDTTGCGDAFHGAYAMALALGRDFEARVTFATAAAAVLASRLTGEPRTPTSEEVEALIATRMPS